MKYLGWSSKICFAINDAPSLTVFSIAVSLFIFSALISLPTVANQVLADTASSSRIITHNKSGLTYSIPIAYRAEDRRRAACEAAGREAWFGGILHDVNDQFPNVAMDHEQAEQMWSDWDVTPDQLGAIPEAAHRMHRRRRDDEALSICMSASRSF